MNERQRFHTNPSHEKLTQPRYSLAYDLIGSEDTMVRHPSGESRRIVSYEMPHGHKTLIREALLSKGLILGKVRSEVDEAVQHFVVPKSARPIAYDARVESAGAFSYNDEQMFFDLGGLLGALYVCDEEQPVVAGNIGHAVALVEFTRPNERQLFFVPGIECITEPLPDGMSPVGYYAGSLYEAFGHRFDVSALSFKMGFTEAATTEGL